MNQSRKGNSTSCSIDSIRLHLLFQFLLFASRRHWCSRFVVGTVCSLSEPQNHSTSHFFREIFTRLSYQTMINVYSLVYELLSPLSPPPSWNFMALINYDLLNIRSLQKKSRIYEVISRKFSEGLWVRQFPPKSPRRRSNESMDWIFSGTRYEKHFSL